MGHRFEHRGALLVEALVSFALCLLASIAFYGLMANTRRADAKARHLIEANSYARQLMESHRQKGYSNLKPGTAKSSKTMTTQTVGNIGKKQRTTTTSASTMLGTVTIYEGPGTGVRSIVVTVAWNDGKVQLESYVTQ